MGRDKREIWETYARAWKEKSAAAKMEALQASVIDDCVYTDPNVVTHGREALIDYMLGFHQQIPGASFDTQYFLTHHGASIARWNMLDGDGTVIGDGISYATYDAEGALTAMTGFFEPSAR